MCVALGVLLLGGAGLYAYLTRPIRIGLSLSLDTALGNEGTIAVRHWLSENPSIGWRPVELLVENPSLEAEAQRAAYRRLESQGVSVILGSAISQTGLVQAEEAARSEVPCFGISASTAALSGRADGFSRIVVGTDEAGEAAAELLRRDYERVAILTGASNRAYTEATGAAMAESLAGKGAAFSLAMEEAALEAVVAYRPQALFLIVNPSDLLRLVKRVRGLGLALPIYSSDWGLLALPIYSPENFEGVRFFSQNGIPVPSYAARLAALQERYDHEPAHTAAYVLSILDIVRRGIEEVGTDPRDLRRWLAEPRTYDYAYGRVHVDAHGDAQRESWYLYQVRDGVLQLEETIPNSKFPDPKRSGPR